MRTPLAQGCRDATDTAAHDWLTAYSLPMGTLDTRAAERVLDRFATRTDQTGPTAATVVRRRRAVFRTYLSYAMRSGLLASDRLPGSDWKAPLVNSEISADLVPSPEQAEELISAAGDCGERGARLQAFFATLFYAGLRPAEANALTVDDLELPASGWGTIHVRRSRTSPGQAFTTTGSVHEQRPLKWRASNATRQVPIPAELVTRLREHLMRYPHGENLLVFTNNAGNPVYPSGCTRAFTLAKRRALPDNSPLQKATPYSLRHANATLLLNAGVPLAEAARRLGHSPEVLLRVYAGVTQPIGRPRTLTSTLP